MQMKYIGVDGFRHDVTLDPYKTPKSKFCAYCCCPCALGCDDEQKSQYRACTKSLTWWLFVLQVACFIAELAVGCGFAPTSVNPLLGPYPKGFYYMGAFQPYLSVRQWQLFRFIVPVLLHGGLIHLALNTWAELRFGLYIERRIGVWRVALLYLLGTIGGCLMSGLFQKAQLSVGASAALCALMSAHAVEILCSWHQTEPRERKMALIQIAVWIALTLALSAVPFVDAGAHMGGLIVGALLGCALFARTVSVWSDRKQTALFWFGIASTGM
jgi:membrane associated rhomboid family serine protease